MRWILCLIFFLLLLPVSGVSEDAGPLNESTPQPARVLYGNIYGVIYAAGTGLPVSGAQVQVRDSCAEAFVLGEAVSGKDGAYLVNAIPIAGSSRSVTVCIKADGLDPVIVEDALILPGALMALQIDLRLTGIGIPSLVKGREISEIVIVNNFRHELRQTQDFVPSPASSEGLASHDYEDNLQLTVFATRLGMVGATTANGHVIREGDHFVALPSLDVLCERGGYEYEVRVEYHGYVETAPVWDVGPWNTHDNYWEEERYRTIYDYLADGGYAGGLGQGMPEAEAAYEHHFYSGRDEFGRIVTDPSGIDLADGTFRDGLGMRDDDWVTVSYLWMDDHHDDDDDDDSVFVTCFIDVCAR